MKILRVILIFWLLSFVHVLYAQKCEHIVQRGEDFESIATKYGVTVEELKKANGESASCYAGRKLQIPYHGVEVKRKPVKVEPYDYKLTSSGKDVLTKSAATTYQVGYANWKKGKFDIAFRYLQSSAEQGEARAYYPLGDCYGKKTLAHYNERTASQCFMKAISGIKDKSDESYWMSCLHLADAYVHAKGVKKDIGQARYYYNLYDKYAIGKHGDEAVKILNELRIQEIAIAKAASTSIANTPSEKNKTNRHVGKKNVLRNGGNSKLPRGCWAASGTDPVDHSQDQNYTRAWKTSWTRPVKGNKETDWIHYICATDHQQAIAIQVYFNKKISKWIASSQVKKYGINHEDHVYVGENDKFWIFSNIDGLDLGLRNHITMRSGYDLYIAKDWSIIGLSNDPEVVYNQIVSERYYGDLKVKRDGMSPTQKINAQMNAYAKMLHEQTANSIKQSIEASDAKIDAINRSSVERYKNMVKTGSSGKAARVARGVRYAPDYTGGRNWDWCSECGKWAPQHTHFDIK